MPVCQHGKLALTLDATPLLKIPGLNDNLRLLCTFSLPLLRRIIVISPLGFAGFWEFRMFQCTIFNLSLRGQQPVSFGRGHLFGMRVEAAPNPYEACYKESVGGVLSWRASYQTFGTCEATIDISTPNRAYSPPSSPYLRSPVPWRSRDATTLKGPSTSVQV